ncbi:MAG TPA: hypothetical protein VH020_16325, partial [Stellaceae bacterium]|nr:hypothetical protein [Stellaceae bacterium]
EQARQAAAEQAHQAEAEQARLAAVHRHDEKLRAERQRQETARRAALVKQAKAANATSQQEQAVQNQLDRASAPARGGQDQPADSRGRHEQNAKLLPQSLPGEGPPLDAGDLPPPAPSAPAEIH